MSFKLISKIHLDYITRLSQLTSFHVRLSSVLGLDNVRVIKTESTVHLMSAGPQMDRRVALHYILIIYFENQALIKKGG